MIKAKASAYSVNRGRPALDPISWIECRPPALSPALDALLLDARSWRSLVTARSLGLRKRRIAAVDTQRRRDVRVAGVKDAFVYPADAGPDSYLTWLKELLVRSNQQWRLAHRGPTAVKTHAQPRKNQFV